MKKAILLLVMGINGLYLSAQENNVWRWGVQWGAYDNQSKFSGGSPNANARFNQNKFGQGSFDIVARYDADKHWMGTFGLGFNTFGFGYAIAENYSLITMKNRYSALTTEFNAVEIPLMIHYKFNPNCKNVKWVVGAGFAASFTEGKTVSKHFLQHNDGATTSDYLSSTSTSNNGGHGMIRFSVGREKLFQRGSILNASLVFNGGLSQVATSTVNYTIDNQNYTHSFSNKGNYIGLRLAYYFRPNAFSSKKRSIESKAKSQTATTVKQ